MKRGKIDKRYSSDVIAALWTDEVERLQKDAAYMKTRRLSRRDPAEFLAVTIQTTWEQRLKL
jgi:hypothetical protein